jgi:hypothetical protein
MARYTLACLNCPHSFDLEQPMSAPLPRRCPKCRRMSLEQDYGAKNVVCRDGVPRTVGQQAEKNAKEMGKEFHRMEAEKILGPERLARRNAPTPWWREDGSKPLDVRKVKDTAKFIRTGEKD